MMRKQAWKWLAASLAAACLLMPAVGATVYPLTEQEKAAIGATHVAVITHADLTETNVDTAQTLTNIFYMPAKMSVEGVAMLLRTAFTAGTTNTESCLLTAGDGTDPDLYLTSTELASDGTEVWVKFGRSVAALATTTLNYAATNPPIVTVTKQNATLNYYATNAPVVTVTKQNETLNYYATNAPVVTVTKQNETLNYAATNPPTVTVQTATFTNWALSEVQYGTFTNVNVEAVTNVFVCPTAVVWATTAYTAVTGATATLTAAELGVTTGATATATLTAAELSVTTGATATATLTAAELSVTTGATATAAVTAGSLAVGTSLTDDSYGRKVYTTADYVDFTFTPDALTSLSQFTAGEVWVYFRLKDAR